MARYINGSLVAAAIPENTDTDPAASGLYVGDDRLGYFDGATWKGYFDSSGNFYFGGSAGATIAWDGSKLYGTDGSTIQWQASSVDGKLTAGAGYVQLDSDGLTLQAYPAGAFASGAAINWRRNGGTSIDGYIAVSTSNSLNNAELYADLRNDPDSAYHFSIGSLQFEIKQSGAKFYSGVSMVSLPTSAGGLSTGDLWTQAGVVRVNDGVNAGIDADTLDGHDSLYFMAAGAAGEAAQDAVGAALTDTASIDFTYNDAANTISAVVLPAGVDHNALANLISGDVHTQYALLAGRSGDTLRLNTTTALTGWLGAGQMQIDKTTTGALLIHTETSTASTGATLELLRRRSGWGVVSQDDRVGTLQWAAADGTDAAPVAAIYAEIDSTPGSNDMPGRLILAVTPDGANALAEALRIDNQSVVNIGQTARLAGALGTALLQIGRTQNGNLQLNRDSADTGGPTLEFLKRRSGWNVINSGDRFGTIFFSAADSVDAAPGASIHAIVDGTPGSNDMPGALIFSTTADGANAVTERMRLDNAGVVSIGNVTPAISDGIGLDINGKIVRLRTSKTPATSSATGNAGEICWDATYFYCCTASNTWKRIAWTTF